MQCLLTDKKISTLKATQRRQEFWDTALPGFGVRVTKTGQKTFFVMCREGGKQKRISLGRYPLVSLAEARESARAKLRLSSLGLPLKEEKQESITVEQVFESFIEIYAKKKNKDWRRGTARLKQTLIKE